MSNLFEKSGLYWLSLHQMWGWFKTWVIRVLSTKDVEGFLTGSQSDPFQWASAAVGPLKGQDWSSAQLSQDPVNQRKRMQYCQTEREKLRKSSISPFLCISTFIKTINHEFNRANTVKICVCVWACKVIFLWDCREFPVSILRPWTTERRRERWT